MNSKQMDKKSKLGSKSVISNSHKILNANEENKQNGAAAMLKAVTNQVFDGQDTKNISNEF
jgi:hypothetical protein